MNGEARSPSHTFLHSNLLDLTMTLHSRFHRSLFAVVFAACVGLFLAGCDSNGTSEQENEPPSADISLDSRSGLTAAFSAAGSTDPDGEITSYEWEFGDGSTDTGETVRLQIPIRRT